MSDFDKFFREKLDEETQFPRREKNWRALSKRLDAFNVGLQEQGIAFRTYLRYWQAAAVFAIVAASLLTWKVVATQNENAKLRQEVAVLQEKNEAARVEIAAAQTLLSSSGGQTRDESSPSRFFGKEEENSGNKKPDRGRFFRNNFPANIAGVSASNVLKTVSYEVQTPSGEQVAATDSSKIETTDLAEFPKWKTLEMLPSGTLANIVSQAETAPTVSPLPQDIAAIRKLIEPVRNPSRFRAGVQYSTGFPQPKEEGISPLIGPGVTGEFNVWRDFWLTASIDWLRFDVSTTKYCPKFHPPHDPPPPPHIGPPWFKEKLVAVESVQRQQHFGVGLRYAFPVRFWMRPSVRAAYNWTRISPELISLKYQHPGWPNWPPPPPKYKAQKSESQFVGNTWRFGFGLERETPSWVFGLWADYSKSFTLNDPSFDMLLFRGGIQYRFN